MNKLQRQLIALTLALAQGGLIALMAQPNPPRPVAVAPTARAVLATLEALPDDATLCRAVAAVTP